MKVKIILSAIATASLSLSSHAGQWSAGAVGLLQSNPYIGGEDGATVFPAVAYQGEKFVLRGPFADYYLIGGERDRPSLSITVGLGPNELEVDNDPILAGIDDRDGSILGGLKYTQSLFGGSFSASLVTDLTNEHQGQRAVVGWQHSLFSATDRSWQVFGGAEVEYLSEDYADYYFGVSENEAAQSSFAAYSVGSIVQPSLTLSGYYNINQQWQIIGNVGWQFLSSDIKDSPIVDQSGVPTGLIGIIYNF